MSCLYGYGQFKTINDIYGHKAGDRVLKLLGNLLLEYSSECLVCRLGGDEFLLFMPNADQNSITEVITAIFKKFNTRKEQDPELHAASISAGLYMCNIEILLTNVIQKLIKHYIS